MIDTTILIKDLDENNISSILSKWNEINILKKEIANIEEMLKTKSRNYLKEREWNKYLDNQTNISVSIGVQQRETVDKKKVKEILTPGQFAEVCKISSFEVVRIITPEQRERLKKIVR